jgi:hypothetical protein
MHYVAGGWRRLHNEELHNLYASPNIIRVIKVEMNSYSILAGKSDLGLNEMIILE